VTGVPQVSFDGSDSRRAGGRGVGQQGAGVRDDDIRVGQRNAYIREDRFLPACPPCITC